MANTYYVYILTNARHTVLYIGVTNSLQRRVNEHKERRVEGFTKRYNVDQLIYFEQYDDIHVAIAREKALKKWRRADKDRLIDSFNPTRRDLYAELL
jgi:putative endonuclease